MSQMHAQHFSSLLLPASDIIKSSDDVKVKTANHFNLTLREREKKRAVIVTFALSLSLYIHVVIVLYYISGSLINLDASARSLGCWGNQEAKAKLPPLWQSPFLLPFLHCNSAPLKRAGHQAIAFLQQLCHNNIMSRITRRKWLSWLSRTDD